MRLVPRFLLLTLALFTMMGLKAQKATRIEGSGNVITKNFPVTAFSSLDAEGLYELRHLPVPAALRGDLSSFVGAEPMTQAEFDRAITGAIRELPGRFETSGAVIAAMQSNDLFQRPDDYYATIATRYRALTLPQLNASLRGALDPKKAIWVVVGDARQVKPQLDTLGLPVEVVPAAQVAGKQESK